MLQHKPSKAEAPTQDGRRRDAIAIVITIIILIITTTNIISIIKKLIVIITIIVITMILILSPRPRMAAGVTPPRCARIPHGGREGRGGWRGGQRYIPGCSIM